MPARPSSAGTLLRSLLRIASFTSAAIALGTIVALDVSSAASVETSQLEQEPFDEPSLAPVPVDHAPMATTRVVERPEDPALETLARGGLDAPPKTEKPRKRRRGKIDFGRFDAY